MERSHAGGALSGLSDAIIPPVRGREARETMTWYVRAQIAKARTNVEFSGQR